MFDNKKLKLIFKMSCGVGYKTHSIPSYNWHTKTNYILLYSLPNVDGL